MKDSEVVQKTTVTNLNWHNAWNNGYINTNLTTIFNKLEEGFNFKEKLSNDKVSTSINLLLEVKQIFLIATTVRMALWIT
jgi:murein L,D-transpeptidase YafK